MAQRAECLSTFEENCNEVDDVSHQHTSPHPNTLCPNTIHRSTLQFAAPVVADIHAIQIASEMWRTQFLSQDEWQTFDGDIKYFPG